MDPGSFDTITRQFERLLHDGLVYHGIASVIRNEIHAAYSSGDALVLNAPFGTFLLNTVEVRVIRTSWRRETFDIDVAGTNVASVEQRFHPRRALQRVFDMTRGELEDETDSFYLWLKGIIEHPDSYVRLREVWDRGTPSTP